METARLSLCSSAASLGPTRRWKTAGTSMAKAASTIMVAPTPAAVLLKLCTENRTPPANRLAPNTSRTLPMMLPVIDALTTSSSPALRANIEMISSAALPKVALSSPPMPGPTRSAIASVAAPICPASGMTAAAESTNTTSPGASRNSATAVAGTKTSNSRSHPTRRGSIRSRQDQPPRCGSARGDPDLSPRRVTSPAPWPWR